MKLYLNVFLLILIAAASLRQAVPERKQPPASQQKSCTMDLLSLKFSL